MKDDRREKPSQDELEERERELQRLRRIHNLRDRDRRTNRNSGCSINALVVMIGLAGLIILSLQ